MDTCTTIIDYLQKIVINFQFKVFIASLFVLGVKINVVLLLKYTTNTYWSSNGYIPTYLTGLAGEKNEMLDFIKS